MQTVLLLAAALGLDVYGLVISLRRWSPRRMLIRRLGPQPAVGPGGRRAKALAARLRQVPLTRQVSPARFRQLQWTLAGVAAAAACSPWLLFGQSPDWSSLAVYPPLLWAAPEFWLWLQLRRRRALIARAYPDLLAHLVTQIRAGAGTVQAFASCPPVLREPLRGEVEELIADLGVAPFPAALERFSARCGTPEIRAFARNVIYRQSLGIALSEVLAAEEAHALAMARLAARRRIQASSVTMAAVTVILLVNGLLIFFLPILADLAGLVAQR